MMTDRSPHKSSPIDLGRYDKLLLAGDGWQLSFVDVTEDDSEDYTVEVIAIDGDRALFAVHYGFNFTDGGVSVEHDDFWHGEYPLTYTRDGDTVDAIALNFFNWSEAKGELITRLDECLTTVAGGWMICEYRRNSEENRKLLTNAKDNLKDFLDTHIVDIIKISPMIPS